MARSRINGRQVLRYALDLGHDRKVVGSRRTVSASNPSRSTQIIEFLKPAIHLSVAVLRRMATSGTLQPFLPKPLNVGLFHQSTFAFARQKNLSCQGDCINCLALLRLHKISVSTAASPLFSQIFPVLAYRRDAHP